MYQLEEQCCSHICSDQIWFVLLAILGFRAKRVMYCFWCWKEAIISNVLSMIRNLWLYGPLNFNMKGRSEIKQVLNKTKKK